MAATAVAPAVAQHELLQPPADGISDLRFAPTSNLLLVSSWDSTVRLYDAQQNSIRARFDSKMPVLSCCFSDTTRAFSGGLDTAVKMYEFKTGTEATLGNHSKGVRCLSHAEMTGQLISAGWDGAMKFWDYRSNSSLLASITLPGKAFTMDVSDYRVLVGTSGRYIVSYDMRKMSEPEQQRESSLKHQTRCIRMFPDGSGFAISSIEGRVAIEYFDMESTVQKKKYAFKCHRHKLNGVDTIFPVNSIAFHPVYGTFVTGGCDGYVNSWDGQNKKRLAQFPKYPTSIAAMDFNHDGSLLAIASSYTYEEGEKDHPNDAIFIRAVAPNEVKPKLSKPGP